MVIIIVLKLDSEINSRHGPSHGLRGSPRLTLVNARIMFFIIIILKLNLRVDQGKMQVTG
jgi:hypothetical protein